MLKDAFGADVVVWKSSSGAAAKEVAIWRNCNGYINFFCILQKLNHNFLAVTISSQVQLENAAFSLQIPQNSIKMQPEVVRQQ